MNKQDSMLRLAWPVAATQLGIMLMGVVDLLCVGHLGARALGAVGLGSALFAWCFVLGLGLLSGLDYLVAHAHGAGDRDRATRALSQGLILIGIAALPLAGLALWIASSLKSFGINPEIIPLAEPYLQIMALSLVPSWIFQACRQALQADVDAKPALYILLVANVLNLLGNLYLIRHYGVVGSAWATFLSRVFMMVALGGYFLKRHPHFRMSFDAILMKHLLKLGVGATIQLIFEMGVFSTVTTLAGRLSTDQVAAHQIVLSVASTTFMIPLGISSATAVLVGRAMGRGDLARARHQGWRGFQLATVVMSVTSALFILFPGFFFHFYTSDESVLAVATRIIVVAGVFQVADGIQVVGAGALRGLGDTKSPAIGNGIGHWLIGFPVGVWLCFYRNDGVHGLWVGLATGLISTAVILLMAWIRRTRRLAGAGH